MASNGATSPRPNPQTGAELRDELIAAVYDQLVQVAAAYLRRERSAHTLEPAALVHEAYVRLSEQAKVEWANEKQVIGIAALMMRRVLTDYARSHRRQKRGGGFYRVDIDDADFGGQSRDIDIIALDEALDRLSAQYPQECKVVELRFFGGLSTREVSQIIGVSESTIKRDFGFARAWLLHELGIK